MTDDRTPADPAAGDAAFPARQAAQAAAFDTIGGRYDEAFPHKEGQLAAGDWLAEQLPASSRVLDVGCGTGVPTLRQLLDAGFDVTGIDISEGMLDLARANTPEATLRRRDVLDLEPDTFAPFDAAVAFFSLLMLPRARIPEALDRLVGVLRPGGLLALAMVEAAVDDQPIPFLDATIRVSGYPRDEFRALIEDAGLSVIELRDYSYAPASPQAQPEVQLFCYCRRI